MKKYKLTKEHEAQLKPWADKWIANAMSTKPMDDHDRDQMRIAIKGLYEAADLAPPPDRRIVFVPSPFVATFAGGFAAAIWWKRKNSQDDIKKATTAATWAATRDATDAATRAATEAATSGASLDEWYKVDLDGIIEIAHKLKLDKFGLECSRNAWRMRQGGNQWSGWESFLTFFRDVAQLPLDYSKYNFWEKGAIHGGPRIMHPEFCIISDRPEKLEIDDQNRPHCEDGPFCRWRDGSALYSWHGTRVPGWIIENPEKITLETIAKEENAEVRRVMCERYGWEEYFKHLLATGACELIDTKDVWGEPVKLYCHTDGEVNRHFVHVINGTEEADGTRHEFTINCKNINNDAEQSVYGTYPDLMERIGSMPNCLQILQQSIRS